MTATLAPPLLADDRQRVRCLAAFRRHCGLAHQANVTSDHFEAARQSTMHLRARNDATVARARQLRKAAAAVRNETRRLIATTRGRAKRLAAGGRILSRGRSRMRLRWRAYADRLAGARLARIDRPIPPRPSSLFARALTRAGWPTPFRANAAEGHLRWRGALARAPSLPLV